MYGRCSENAEPDDSSSDPRLDGWGSWSVSSLVVRDDLRGVAVVRFLGTMKPPPSSLFMITGGWGSVYLQNRHRRGAGGGLELARAAL